MLKQESYLTNTRGLKIEGFVGNAFSFSSKFYETQVGYPGYIHQTIVLTEVAPGQGAARPFNATGWDVARAEGSISVAINKHVHLFAGHGKHFIGHGYRSLLLSDNSFSYPFANIAIKFKHVNVNKIYASLMHNPVNIGDIVVQKKSSVFTTIELYNSHLISFSYFEGSLWNNPDTTDTYKWGARYINPVPIIALFDTNNHTVAGLNLKLQHLKKIEVYAQCAWDDRYFIKKKQIEGIDNKSLAWQIGIKLYNILSFNGLYAQMEYSHAKPNTFAHKNQILSYSHYNQSLTHPLGAAFNEYVFRLKYYYKRFSVHAHLSVAHSYPNSYQGDILLPLKKREIAEQTKKLLNYNNFEASYLLNHKTNLKLCLGRTQRKFENSDFKMYYVSFVTDIDNYYFDF
ncbi:MAG: hypothetical protein HC896_01485 [Bacteroidales bacterium]|nr:hypothetical protein [Bacteroidales bacterium]